MKLSQIETLHKLEYLQSEGFSLSDFNDQDIDRFLAVYFHFGKLWRREAKRVPWGQFRPNWNSNTGWRTLGDDEIYNSRTSFIIRGPLIPWIALRMTYDQTPEQIFERDFSELALSLRSYITGLWVRSEVFPFETNYMQWSTQYDYREAKRKAARFGIKSA